MRVLFISHGAGTDGGAEKVLLTILRNLDRSRYTPLAVVPGVGPMAEELDRLDVPYHVIPQFWMIFRRATRAVQTVNCLLNAGPVGRLCEVIERERIDVVYSNSSVIFGGGVAARLTGRPHVWHLHELIWENPSMDFGFGPRVLTAAVRTLADQVVAVSHATAQDFGFPEPDARVAVVPNALSPAVWTAPEPGNELALRRELGIAPDARVLLFLGSLAAYKVPERAVATLAALRRKDAHLLMVGNPGGAEIMGRIQEEIDRGRVAAQVTLAGYRTDVRQILGLAEVSLVPTTTEAWGLATAEAMAAGLPVVAGRGGNNVDLLEDGRTGYLVERGDPVLMAEKVALLLNDRGLRQRIGAAAREASKEYTVDRQVAGVTGALEHAAAAPVRRWTASQLLRAMLG